MKSKKVYRDYHWARDESILDDVLEVNVYRDVLKHFPVIHKRCKRQKTVIRVFKKLWNKKYYSFEWMKEI